jgi:hypothetical protein
MFEHDRFAILGGVVGVIFVNALVALSDCWVDAQPTCCEVVSPSGPQPNLRGRDCDNESETPPICPDDPISNPRVDHVRPARQGEAGRQGVNYGSTNVCKWRVWACPLEPGGPCRDTGLEYENTCNTSKVDPQSGSCTGQQQETR